jgi:hypothetical protein
LNFTGGDPPTGTSAGSSPPAARQYPHPSGVSRQWAHTCRLTVNFYINPTWRREGTLSHGRVHATLALTPPVSPQYIQYRDPERTSRFTFRRSLYCRLHPQPSPDAFGCTVGLGLNLHVTLQRTCGLRAARAMRKRSSDESSVASWRSACTSYVRFCRCRF